MKCISWIDNSFSCNVNDDLHWYNLYQTTTCKDVSATSYVLEYDTFVGSTSLFLGPYQVVHMYESTLVLFLIVSDGVYCPTLICLWEVRLYNWRGTWKNHVRDFLGRFFSLVPKWAQFLYVTLDLTGKHRPMIFFCCFVFRFREICLNQPWWQMRASLILLFGKTKAFFGKDIARKKPRFCICYLWKMKEKPANLNSGVCFSLKWKATCKNCAHLDEEKKFGPKSHLRGSSTQPFNFNWQ